MHHLKKLTSQVYISPQGLKRLFASVRLASYITMSTWYITFQFIENIQIKDFNKNKKPIIF